MSNCNCYVCGRGFDHIDLLEAHVGEHPGRTVEEMAQAAEAWGRLRGTDRAWMLREAEHNDQHEITTAIPGLAVNDAASHQSNRERAAAIGAKAKHADLTGPHGAEDEDDLEVVTPISFVDKSPVSREEWAQHDAHAEAQRKPHAELAQDYAARHLYKARQIPYLDAVGLHRNAEYARREDAAEEEVRAEREAVLDEMDRRDEALASDGMVKTESGDEAFHTGLPDTPRTRELFRDHKAKLMAERAAESAAMFAEQFPEEAKKRGLKATRLSARQRANVDQQKKDAARATERAKKQGGSEAVASPEPVLAQFNEPVAPPEAKPPEPPPTAPQEEDRSGD